MNTQQILELIKSHPACVSVETYNVPNFLQNQITDNDIILFDIIFQKNEIKRKIIILLNLDYIKNIDLNISNVDHLVDDLTFCDKGSSCFDDGCDICIDGGPGSYGNISQNMGEPPTYYIEPTQSLAIRLKSFEVPEVEITEELQELINRILQVQYITGVSIENVRHTRITEKLNRDDGVVLILDRPDHHTKINIFYPLSVLQNVDNHNSIIENIIFVVDTHKNIVF
jgi:hypothetical protein